MVGNRPKASGPDENQGFERRKQEDAQANAQEQTGEVEIRQIGSQRERIKRDSRSVAEKPPHERGKGDG